MGKNGIYWLAACVCVQGCLCLVSLGCRESHRPSGEKKADRGERDGAAEPAAIRDATPAQRLIVEAARSQVGRTVTYDPAYVRLAYPGGDVPVEKGVCTDVAIRALRDSLKMDLQKLVHEDMTAAFAQYPRTWGLSRPDPNIDHRRVPNLMRFFDRSGWSQPVTANKEDYQPGDLVTCTVGSGRPHIMVVSDRLTPAGVLLVIHNIGRGAREEDSLFSFPITGHFRVKARE